MKKEWWITLATVVTVAVILYFLLRQKPEKIVMVMPEKKDVTPALETAQERRADRDVVEIRREQVRVEVPDRDQVKSEAPTREQVRQQEQIAQQERNQPAINEADLQAQIQMDKVVSDVLAMPEADIQEAIKQGVVSKQQIDAARKAAPVIKERAQKARQALKKDFARSTDGAKASLKAQKDREEERRERAREQRDLRRNDMRGLLA